MADAADALIDDVKSFLQASMPPAEYRAKWKLPADDPMVAPDHAARRRAIDNTIGFGRKPGAASAPDAAAPKQRAGGG